MTTIASPRPRPLDIQRALRAEADPMKACLLARFFKTAPGEYGAGDIFLGLTVPRTRALAKQYHTLSFSDIAQLFRSPYHEERLAALLVLVHSFEHSDDAMRKSIFGLYIKNTTHINNWDLVDLSAPNIVGEYLTTRPTKESKEYLARLARSRSLWERRIAVLATFAFIKRGSAHETFRVADLLLRDQHDLIHKAVGWMLREVGKRVSREAEERFLRRRYKKMPRTMLRYAIERFPRERYRAYLAGQI